MMSGCCSHACPTTLRANCLHSGDPYDRNNKAPSHRLARACRRLAGRMRVGGRSTTTLDQEYHAAATIDSAEVGAQKMQFSRLQDAVKVSVNSELLFTVWWLADVA